MVTKTVRVLLLQARTPGDPARAHEVACFARASGLPAERFTTWDLLDGPPSAAALEAHDAVMVGGAGDFLVSAGDLPHFEPILDGLRELVAEGTPTFASCFGYQLLVHALGGEVSYDPARAEVGTFELGLTDEGRDDPLFGSLPGRFPAQLGHKDRALRHPAGVPNLAGSERSPYQALRVPGAPIWATQFHPELRAEDNVWRYNTYLREYGGADDPVARQRVIDSHRPSPEATDLLRRFLELIFG